MTDIVTHLRENEAGIRRFCWHLPRHNLQIEELV